MSDRDLDAEAVRGYARAYGVALDDAAVAEHRDRIETMRTRFGALTGSVPESRRATDVRPGEDEYNAFFRRFDLPAADGPLSDLAVGVKENLAVAGVPMTCGSAALEFTPDYSATVVRRLREAGAGVVGTTNMDEFALFTTGETCAHGRIENPAAPGRVPGGSSSGSGAAVAAGLVDAALGSDTGGSIRIPASFCGVVGLKPTHRTVPRFGFADLAPSLDHVGPLARDVETAARVLETIQGPDVNDPSTHVARPTEDVVGAVGESVEDVRVGLVEQAFSAATDGVADRVRATVDALGVETESLKLPTVATPLSLAGIIGAEFLKLVENEGQVYATGTGYSEPWRRAVGEAFEAGEIGENVREQLILARGLLDLEAGTPYVTAQNARRDFLAQCRSAFEAVDALVMPTTPTTALPYGELDVLDDLLETLANTGPWNLTGHPALSVPCGAVEGRPVGCQVVTDWYDEPTAVRLGSAVERLAD